MNEGCTKPRVVLSTGPGRLHLATAASRIKRAGAEVSLVQGWVPKNQNSGLINLLGWLAGSKNLSRGMAMRRPDGITDEEIQSCWHAEFFLQGLLLLSRKGVISHSRAALLGWKVFGKASRKYLRNGNIFHVRSGAGVGGAIATAKQRGFKVLVDHSIAHPSFMERQLGKEYANFGKSFCMGPVDPFWASVLQDCMEADLLLVNSEFVKTTFVAEGYPEDRIAVVYLGVREDFFGLKKQYSRAKPITLLFTGGFGFRKGAHYLLQSLQELDRASIDYEMIVVGSNTEASDIIKQHPLKGKLTLVGPVPQDSLKAYLSGADLYVFPTLAEGCASSCMEAMAAGLPVITTRECGTPIVHNKDGWIVPAKSPSAIASAIRELLANEAFRRGLGTAAAKTIALNYNWTGYGNQVVSLYNQLLQNVR